MQPWNPDSGISHEDWQKDYNRITYGDERGYGYGNKTKPSVDIPGFGGLTPDPSVMGPNVRTKIEDFLRQMDDSGGMFPWNDFDKYLGRPGSRPEDRIVVEEQWGNTPGPAVREPTIPGLGPGYGTTPTNPWPQSLPGGRVNQPPRPEGLQRVATGIADWLTGNKWDLDQRGGSGTPRGRGQYDPREANYWGKVAGTEVTNTDGTTLTPPGTDLTPGVADGGAVPLPLPAGHERGTPVPLPLPLPEVPGNAVTRGLPTGPKPSGMSWDDWYGQHGLKTLLGRWDGSQAWNKGGEGVQYRM